MANNYLLFSEVIPKLTQKEAAWLREYHSTKAAAANCDGDSGVDFQMEISEEPSREYGKRHAWIYTEENGNVDDVASMVHEFLKKFRPKGIWFMTWATTCSKPRVGEFDGGCVAVTAYNISWTGSWKFKLKAKALHERRMEKKGKK